MRMAPGSLNFRQTRQVLVTPPPATSPGLEGPACCHYGKNLWPLLVADGSFFSSVIRPSARAGER